MLMATSVFPEASYTINGIEFSVAAGNKAITTSDGVKFNLSTDTVTYNSMAFSGTGTLTFTNERIMLTGGASVVSTDEAGSFNFYDSQSVTISGDDSVDFIVNGSAVTGVIRYD